MALGYSFSPTTDNAEMGKRGGQPPYRNQDPIRTLHFELPRVTGAQSANAISPLVGGDRAGSSIGQAVLQSVLKTVLGADAASALISGSPAAASMASPRMGTPGAPVNAAPRVRGGVTGGVDIERGPEVNNIPKFGTQPVNQTPNPVFRPGGSTDPVEGDGWTKVPEPNPNESAPTAPDFGRGPSTFGGGMDNEGRMNSRSPLYFDKFANL